MKKRRNRIRLITRSTSNGEISVYQSKHDPIFLPKCVTNPMLKFTDTLNLKETDARTCWACKNSSDRFCFLILVGIMELGECKVI